jgi:hypothetical protein
MKPSSIVSSLVPMLLPFDVKKRGPAREDRAPSLGCADP